jgi:hypothetical protein
MLITKTQQQQQQSILHACPPLSRWCHQAYVAELGGIKNKQISLLIIMQSSYKNTQEKKMANGRMAKLHMSAAFTLMSSGFRWELGEKKERDTKF